MRTKKTPTNQTDLVNVPLLPPLLSLSPNHHGLQSLRVVHLGERAMDGVGACPNMATFHPRHPHLGSLFSHIVGCCLKYWAG